VPSDFPRSPKLIKGALITYEANVPGALPNVVVFQYNPEQLSRSVSLRRGAAGSQGGGASGAGDQQTPSEPRTVEGLPRETIDLSVTLDASDQLEEPESNPEVVAQGLHPAISSLELLVYPTETQVLTRALQQDAPGQKKVLHDPKKVPVVLFVWGTNRVVPVRLTSFSVTEKAFDARLNPIRADVDLSMSVLTPADFADEQKQGLAAQAYEVDRARREAMARLNMVGAASDVVRSLPF
jgi:hypothetical protein